MTNTGLWGGSLLVSLGQMLAQTRRELVVFSPYWRVEGVKSLLAAVGRARYDGVSVIVYTQSANRIATEDQQGVRCFKNLLQIAGAKVAILAPKTINGASPFIHAKLMIADGVRAYVGSANFTSSGLDYSIESGVMVEGEVARSFGKWAQALSASCSLWPDGH
ncbi:phospholipase D-like domain-containing protein [Variovorax sp. RTB1]|uniref:phospholipase D-like domain-containing protein n=1 Tax=Variovorax sp. RTB1 TaxID=3048631 RepID=UPI002B22AF82|nr:phospholipase D-like domain-containing protein [Variovorax sp. RTB1]MEB0114118.1 phospholipase D-like domain-containing protein [Variovorax sp. RTB1]